MEPLPAPDRDSLNYAGSSRFTYHHLDLLAQSSPTSPLRVVALIDYDAFYAQCETARLDLDPTQPLAVRQWNALIALNYPARQFGLKRGVSVEDAQKLCPDLVMQHVATWRAGDSNWRYRDDVLDYLTTDKAALDPYRAESRKTIRLIKDYLPSVPSPTIERASIDEVYIDLSAQIHSIISQRCPETLTDRPLDPDSILPMPRSQIIDEFMSHEMFTFPQNTKVTPDWDNLCLYIGAKIVGDIREELRRKMKYTSSAGISHNKLLAKLAASYRKPDNQTVLTREAVPDFLRLHKVKQLSGLAGKLGSQVVENFGTEQIADLFDVSISRFSDLLGTDLGKWVFNAIRGFESSPVRPRDHVQSATSAKTFVPHLQKPEEAIAWLRMFAADLTSRVQDLNAESGQLLRPGTIALHHSIRGRFGPTRTKQMQIPPSIDVDEDLIYDLSKTLLGQFESKYLWPCMGVSITLTNFKITGTTNSITRYFVKKPLPFQTKREIEELTDPVEAQYLPKRRRHESPEQTGSEKGSPPSVGRKVSSEDESVDSALGQTDDGYNCPICHGVIAADEVLEHLDWHVAVEIEQELTTP